MKLKLQAGGPVKPPVQVWGPVMLRGDVLYWMDDAAQFRVTPLWLKLDPGSATDPVELNW